ncbi:hypothetical protein BH09PSE3_BH09PSE3_14790 [soil metagenome]
MRSIGSFKRALIVAGAIALLSLGGMALTLALGLAQADRLIDRVSRSQTQLALVTRLEGDLNALAIAPSAAGSAELARSLAAYRATVDAETRVLPAADRSAQRIEADRAARLADLIARNRPGDRAEFRTLARTIVDSERREAAESIVRMRELRRTGTTVAIALPIALAVIGTFGMIAMLANLLGPIAALRRGVAGLATGRHTPIKPAGFSDFDDLTHAFVQMAGQISTHRDALAGANAGLEAQVAARTASLAAIDANRRLFFAQVSHELRTPITVIMGETEVALRDATAPVGRLREALGHVVANGQFVQRRLEDLLSLASAEDGRLMLHRERVDIGAVVQRAAAQASPYARSSGIAIATICPDDPMSVMGDESWLQQGLLALIDNAVKHAGGSAIEMVLERHADHARLTVTDDGPGVAVTDLPLLFDTYYQASARRGGSGLGLAVARWVAEAHKGQISAENRNGGGLSVHIDLPLAA